MSNYTFEKTALDKKLEEIEKTIPEVKKVDSSKFKPFTTSDLIDVLGLTIKRDNARI